MSADRTARDPLIIAAALVAVILNPWPISVIYLSSVMGKLSAVACRSVSAVKESGASKRALLKGSVRCQESMCLPFIRSSMRPLAGFAAVLPQVPEAPERIQRAIVPDLMWFPTFNRR